MNIFMEVNNYCELKCRFCVADMGYKYPKTNITSALIDEIIHEYREEKNNAVFITGGEPLLHPDITNIIKKFSSANYYTYITTNGQRFSDETFAVDFISSGIHRIAIPIYGNCAEIHDTLTGVSGSFESLQKGLDNIFYIKNKYIPNLKIELRLLMTKYNIRNNVDVIDWIASNYPHVDYVTILGLQLSSRTNNYEQMIEISMTEAAPYLRLCLNRIRKYAFKCIITGIPICVLGEEYSDFYVKQFEKKEETVKLFPHLSVQPHLKKLEDCMYRENSSKQKPKHICGNCRYFDVCEGVQERYIKKFDFFDLNALI